MDKSLIDAIHEVDNKIKRITVNTLTIQEAALINGLIESLTDFRNKEIQKSKEDVKTIGKKWNLSLDTIQVIQQNKNIKSLATTTDQINIHQSICRKFGVSSKTLDSWRTQKGFPEDVFLLTGDIKQKQNAVTTWLLNRLSKQGDTHVSNG